MVKNKHRYSNIHKVKLDCPGVEQGFSMISVIVVMGVVLTAILMISKARVNFQSTQKAIKLKQAYSDVNQALVTDLVGYLHTNLAAAAPCINPAAIAININAGNVVDAASPSYVYSNAIPSVGAWPPTHQAAAGRCRTPRTPTNANLNTDNRIYFCIRLGRDVNAPRDSIVNSPMAFAEVAVELIDLQTQQAISCSAYSTKKSDPKDGSAGMAVTMALYWQSQLGSRINYSQKALSYISNQN